MENGAQVQLQSFPASPARYAPKLLFFGYFSRQQGVRAIHECALYTDITIIAVFVGCFIRQSAVDYYVPGVTNVDAKQTTHSGESATFNTK